MLGSMAIRMLDFRCRPGSGRRGQGSQASPDLLLSEATMGGYGAWYWSFVGMLGGLTKSSEHPSKTPLGKDTCYVPLAKGGPSLPGPRRISVKSSHTLAAPLISSFQVRGQGSVTQSQRSPKRP